MSSDILVPEEEKMPVHPSLFRSVFLGLCSFAFAKEAAAAILTSDYRDLPPSPLLVTYSQGSVPANNLTKLGPVQITNSPANLIFAGFSFIHGTPSDPADVGGWGNSGNLTLNLSQGVAALGVTFDCSNGGPVSVLSVYDGLNGTGNLLGKISSTYVPPPWSATRQPIDFVAVISDGNIIRSAVLSDVGGSVAIRAIAITVPEPDSLWCSVPLLPAALSRRRR